MPITRNQKVKGEGMEPKSDPNPNLEPQANKELTTDEKLDKLLKNSEDVLKLKDDLTQLTDSVKGLTVDITALKVNTDSIPKIQTTLTSLQNSISNLTVECAANTIDLKESKARILTLEAENVTLKSDLDNLKSHIRRDTNTDRGNIDEIIETHITRLQDKNSLLLEGISENKSENIKSLVRQISYDAGLTIQDLDITDAYRMGRYNQQDKRPRTIKVTFLSRNTRNQIYVNRNDIKQNPACKHVWINECLDEEQKRVRAEVRSIVDLAKSQGKEARAVGDTAIISGIKYHHSTFATLPPELTLERAYTRELNGKLFFNSEHSPLSSFYPLEIEYDNHKYQTNEQGFQHQKAITLGKVDIANQIKKQPSPRKCKALGKQLGHSKIWDDKREKVMEDLVNIKAQHPEIRDKLLKTGNKTLVECTSDNFWACGGSFRSRKVQNGEATGKTSWA